MTRSSPAAHGGYVAPVHDDPVVDFLLVHEVAAPPTGARVVGAAGDWRVYGRCS